MRRILLLTPTLPTRNSYAFVTVIILSHDVKLYTEADSAGNPLMQENIRVVIAEDSPTVRAYLKSLIDETPGMQVIGVAHNGEEAVTLVQELKPDVVSMDISMPRIDGLEATR